MASRRGDKAADTDQGAVGPDEHYAPEGEIVAAAEVALGLVAPVQQYAMIDNALRHAEGRSIDQHLDQLARLLSGFQQVASSNPEAAFPETRTEAFLRQPGPGNRPLAFPYAKWHSTQWTVDQAAALLLCSVETARAHGVSPDRWLFPHVALESSHALPLSGRAELHRWPAMAILGEAAAQHVGRPLHTIEYVDLYSCFPAAVRVQQRELGLPLDGVPTVTGGMAFAGGPLNNYTYQSTAALAGCLRQSPESLGMVSTVSGLLTKPGIAVWSATPPGVPPLIADLAAGASAATARVQVADDYRGPARVATYTVTYADDDPRQVWAIADTVDGRRCLAVCSDPGVAERATGEELIGHAITVGGRVFEIES
jgi:acetyl-CoA C-acetyltransferase